MEAGRIVCTRIGGQLLFGRLWERLGIAERLGQLLTDHGFEFAVERGMLLQHGNATAPHGMAIPFIYHANKTDAKL